MSNTQRLITTQTIEDWLTWFIPIAVSLAGFNWASLVPGTNNPFLIAVAFGFAAKFLTGLVQNGWKSWEDLIPTITISLGFLVTVFSANPQYLAYGTAIGFIVKALGVFQKQSDGTYGNIVEDVLLFVGGLLISWGTAVGNQEIAAAGALLSLVGKTAPSIGASLKTSVAPVSTGG